MTEYPYRYKWSKILASAGWLLLGLWLVHRAWIEPTFFNWGIAVVLTPMLFLDTVWMIVHRLAFPQVLRVRPTSWRVPSRTWSRCDTEIPLAEIQVLSMGVDRFGRLLTVRHAGKNYTIHAEMLPSPEDFDALLVLLLQTVNATAVRLLAQHENRQIINLGIFEFPTAMTILFVGWGMLGIAGFLVGLMLIDRIPFGWDLVVIAVFLLPGLVLRAIAVRSLEQQEVRGYRA